LAPAIAAGAPDGLLPPGEAVLDLPAARAELDALADLPREQQRQAAASLLRARHDAARERIAAAVRANPLEAHRAIRDYAALTDAIVCLVLDFVRHHLHPLPNPTASERLCVLAVGGYGRGEMAPHSDVDLLFLTPYKQTAWTESMIESVLYTLWDLRMKVGQSVRTVTDCLRLARGDVTVRTSLLEHRILWGDAALGAELHERLWRELFDKTGPEFVEMKLAERAERHRRQGSTRYLLEPNVKESKGGLRDLQTLYWIAKYLNHADTPEDLVARGVFTPDEFRIFQEAAAFLWTTRVHLHLATGRATEQLTFDLQIELAATLGFASTRAQRGVERFMQRYFREAKNVGDLTRIFLASLKARHAARRPSLGQTIRTAFAFGRNSESGSGFRLRGGWLEIADEAAFLSQPLNFLRLFEEALRSGSEIHPDALRLVAANLDRIDDALREDPEANRLFLRLLLSHNNPERTLRHMNEVGLLGAFIPEFGRIVAMMQFNMYHHYTVDEHIIQTISTLSQIERKELKAELPVVTEIVAKGINRRILYVALLLHDIGKGAGRDHSEVGAEIASRLAPRFGLSEEEAEAVVWLVRNHLLMSDTAQKRDLADPRTVRDFAAAVKSPSRLKMLALLTVCDIRGVGPGVWNNWKAMLLRALYNDTLDLLTGGSQAQSRPEREAAAKEALAGALVGWEQARIEAELARHYPPYWLGLDTRAHVIFADLAQRIEANEAAMHFELAPERDATLACFAMQDHPGIFARLAGALALAGANVVDARTYTTTDGIATAAFWIQDLEGKPYERSRLSRLRATVGKILNGELKAGEALRDRDRIKKREQGFVVPTSIQFDNSGSDIYTIIEVVTRDRPGLLHDLARTLTASNISIASAIIATYGEQAVDVFYVKDVFGLKLHSEAKRRALEARLRAAITPLPLETAGAGQRDETAT
jgi:[protein-PII] uridylyltransferase